MPTSRAQIIDTELVVLDIETDGIDPTSAQVLSIGWVVMQAGRVVLDSAQRWLVCPEGPVGRSATIHGLTDTQLAEGHDLNDVMDQVVETLTGRVLVVHHAGLDQAILNRECLRRFGAKLWMPTIDTLAMARKRAQRQHHLGGAESLRLMDLRAQYRLPLASSHDCLGDALATAELLLAMLAHHEQGPHTLTWALVNA